MNDKNNYKLANIRRKEFALLETRQAILKQDGQQALESILDAPAPATLIQSFSDQDLYYLMHKIGPADFIPVLSLAASEQWEYILDLEIWDNDRIDFKNTSKVLDILFQAAPQRLMRWMVKEKTDLMEYYYFKHMDIKIREHDEPPPEDHNDYTTFDDKFYFRFLKSPKGLDRDDENAAPADDLAPELIEKMLKTVASMDISVFHGLMLESGGILPAETEEEQFRQKNIRLAEKWFLPSHEAMGIYQPTGRHLLTVRPETPLYKKERFDPDMPLPPQYHTQYIQGTTLFEKAFSQIPDHLKLDMDSELAALISKLISADKVKIKENEDLERAIKKTLAFLSLGLEVLIGPDQSPTPFAGAAVIEIFFLEDIFRTASSKSIALKARVMTWHADSFMQSKGLPLSFLDETWLGVVGGLFLDRPLFFDNYQTGNDLYRPFETLNEINATHRVIEAVMAVDTILKQMDTDTATFDSGILTYKTLLLTLWAKDRLGLDPDLSAIETDRFKPFFKEMFDSRNRDIRLDDFMMWAGDQITDDIPDAFNRVAGDLFSELEEEYAPVSADQVDPRFIGHFLLK